MRRRDFIKVIGGTIVSWPLSAREEQPNRVWRVGMPHVVPDQLGFTAFRKKLSELGYVEGQNIVFGYRWSDQAQRLPALGGCGVAAPGICTADFFAGGRDPQQRIRCRVRIDGGRVQKGAERSRLC